MIEQSAQPGEGGTKTVRLLQPVPGRVIPLSDVPDPVFSEQMLGPGLAIVPSSGEVVAPADGEVTVLYRTAHALVLTTSTGLQLLVHVGIDTVSISSGFTALVKQGDRVRAGQALLRVDLDALEAAGRASTTVVVVMNDPAARIEFFD